MDNKEYEKNVLKTANNDREAIAKRLQGKNMDQVLHAILGLHTESAEAADQLKKHIYYGRELDLINLEEELSDCLWYITIGLHYIGSNLETAMQKNIEKLRLRYGESFSEEKAINRNVEAERKILENN